ncbi:MAG: ribosome small subunit-dependent GTPase A [Planctomycetota bacterium]
MKDEADDDRRSQRKVRTEFRKNRAPRTRSHDVTRRYQQQGESFEDDTQDQRISGKGELNRKRTVLADVDTQGESGFDVRPVVDESVCRPGRVLAVFGMTSEVEAADGKVYRCVLRRLLRTLATDQRHVIVTGDRVLFRVAGEQDGVIERVEPRRGVLSRTSRQRRHMIVSNVDQLLIMASAAQPDIKPNLIDRFLVVAEQSRIRPIICINKIDLVNPADLQPLVGVYGQMGYRVICMSVTTGQGVEEARRLLRDRQSAIAGQSGVGKSSLLNAIDPALQLRVGAVSEETEKGKHTTTISRLWKLASGGYVVDTPGIRQFELWDVIPAEVANYYRDLRPYVSLCRFPNCTHTHEAHCAVKDAVADGHLDARRYESYCHLRSGE